MSTTPSTRNSDTKERVVESYLEAEVRAGEMYFKSRFIAENVELSAHEVGATLHKLQQQSDLLDIEQWSYTSGTTWRVTLNERAE